MVTRYRDQRNREGNGKCRIDTHQCSFVRVDPQQQHGDKIIEAPFHLTFINVTDQRALQAIWGRMGS